MEPSINISLTMLAQELLQRVKPLLKDEYEQSRLNSWVVLLILASMDLDKSVQSLQEQNNLIRGWLSKFLADIKDKNLNVKNQHYWVKDYSNNENDQLDRKRSHKRRRKIRKPVKGLR